jgi:hypothetical protein
MPGAHAILGSNPSGLTTFPVTLLAMILFSFLAHAFRIKKDCGKTLAMGGYRIILYAYPSVPNGHIFREHPLSQLLKSWYSKKKRVKNSPNI